ncbi:MAG: dioxygenase [Vibrio sp.]
MKNAPAMFVSHGSPMFAIEQSHARDVLEAQRSVLADVNAIVIVSAHWVTDGYIGITSDSQPQTIHDFGGFPQALYELQYPAKGDPLLAEQIKHHLQEVGYSTKLQSSRGLDHGAWVPLMHLVPDANIPVVQVSINAQLNGEEIYQLGKHLLSLREQNIAVIGSGSLTHNLYEVERNSDSAAEYVVEFERWIREQVVQRDLIKLIEIPRFQPDFSRAHPSHEHYLPLLVALGASQAQDKLTVLQGGIQHKVLSMESYLWQ